MITLYRLRIELSGSSPKIWRSITVPSGTPFDQLHDIIRIVMDLPDESEYEFKVGKTLVRDFGPDIDDRSNPNDRDSMDTFLEELVTMEGTTFTYTVDERWQHTITLEKVLISDEQEARPVCNDGEGIAVPPDAEHTRTVLKREGGKRFDKEEVNRNLNRYCDEWEEIYAEQDEFEADENSDSDRQHRTGYQKVKHLRSPLDLLKDEFEKRRMQNWLDSAVLEENSPEKETFVRLTSAGHGPEESWEMLWKTLAIEVFYELKYGIYIIEDRYEYNLSRLPEEPLEIPSLRCACEVLDSSTKGIPFTAIEYVHNHNSPEARTAIVNALNKASNHKDFVEESTILWYACAAEGHLCEGLIDPVIGFYSAENIYYSDWLHNQGQYLIGKLAQKYPAITVEKVLDFMEQEARDSKGSGVYFLFDVFDFCEAEIYKDRLLSLLKNQELSYYSSLAITVAHLKLQEALPILTERIESIKRARPEKGTWHQVGLGDLEEAVEELETGVDLYPEISMPLCLSRKKTWREAFANAEEYFYSQDLSEEDDFDSRDADYFGNVPDFGWSPQQPIVKENKTGRNDPCPCGSGKKYKKCCLDKDVREEITRTT